MKWSVISPPFANRLRTCPALLYQRRTHLSGTVVFELCEMPGKSLGPGPELAPFA